MTKLLLIGAGGQGKVCLDIAKKMKKWDTFYFLDDKLEGYIMGTKILGLIDIEKYKNDGFDIFVSIGDNLIRSRLLEICIKHNFNIVNLISNSTYLSPYCNLGFGIAIMPGVIINANTTIDNGAIINSGAIIEHDCNIGKFSHISPGSSIGGSCNIGEFVWIGIGATLINNLVIEKNVMIGAGSVVVKSIVEPGTYFGVPAKKRG